MATIGHIAVGMAAARWVDQRARPRWRSMALWSALALLPDADVIGLFAGVEYAAPWGHRGVTHSLAFATIVGVTIGLLARRFALGGKGTVLAALIALVSHGLLDTFTYGGLGCALLWPFSLTRFSAPWRPIEAAPIGLRLLSVSGLGIALIEAVLFSPLFVYALTRPRHAIGTAAPLERAALRRRRGLTVAMMLAWITAVWMIVSTDPLREAAVGLILREDTKYTPGYSEADFRRIAVGMSEDDVRRLLPTPYAEDRRYPPVSVPGCRVIRLELGKVVTALQPEHCAADGVTPGMPAAALNARMGRAGVYCWHYTWSPSRRHYRERLICVERGQVFFVSRRWR
jgi:inner membrane protein